jgi:hypothetical protein
MPSSFTAWKLSTSRTATFLSPNDMVSETDISMKEDLKNYHGSYL